MTKNLLKLNASKTKIMIITQSSYNEKIHIKNIDIAGADVKVTNSAKKIGFTLDRNMKKNEHISNVCRVAMFHLQTLTQCENIDAKNWPMLLYHLDLII